MADTNITVVGNLTREPELRFTNGGKGVASFGIAVSRRYQVNNEWQEKTSFFNVSAWDNLGENVAATLTKGMRVIVTGRLEVREYEAREGGKRTSVDIIADEIGPSLRWARATVERTERSDGGQGGGGNYGGGGQRGGSSSGGQRPSDSVYGDEEPF
ncbi:MAG: single-stranded DNA-binding protein [Actinomycetota bacterium]|jgi:single-strand DNA-binding protein